MRSIVNFQFSIFHSHVGKWLATGIAVALALVVPVAAWAQGCAMCYTSASAAKKAGMEALRNGVLVLLFPPLLIFAAILWHTFHRRSADESRETSRGLGGGLTPQPCELEPTLDR
ncbi:MAG: hypothetical protein HY508_06175 [Acidobacteria bacterium]|nr:hypothetical protein [Acidobacteriota bacterium]